MGSGTAKGVVSDGPDFVGRIDTLLKEFVAALGVDGDVPPLTAKAALQLALKRSGLSLAMVSTEDGEVRS